MISQKTKLRPQGFCVFCERPGLTKQHVWPAWLKKYNLPEDTHHYQYTAGMSHRDKDAPVLRMRSRQGHSGSRKLHKVCQSCNGGWMRRLEESVMRLVLQLMNGEPISISDQDQRRLAAWLALVTIMSEFTDVATQTVPPSDRRILRETQEPPPGWHVYIARYGGTNWRQHICRHYGMQLGETLEEHVQTHKCDTQTSTFVIGQLCAHTFSSTVMASEFQGYDGAAISQIWPIANSSIDWGTRPLMGDRGVLSLSSALIRAIPRASD